MPKTDGCAFLYVSGLSISENHWLVPELLAHAIHKCALTYKYTVYLSLKHTGMFFHGPSLVSCPTILPFPPPSISALQKPSLININADFHVVGQGLLTTK